LELLRPDLELLRPRLWLGFPTVIFCWRVSSGMAHDSADHASREAATAWACSAQWMRSGGGGSSSLKSRPVLLPRVHGPYSIIYYRTPRVATPTKVPQAPANDQGKKCNNSCERQSSLHHQENSSVQPFGSVWKN